MSELLGGQSRVAFRPLVVAALGVLAALLLARPCAAQVHLRLATTTSTENSGLLGHILPPFEQGSGIKVDVIAVGSGKALKLAENGDVDVVLSHAPDLEAAFVQAGFGVNRRDVMYNDFVLVGPADDPAQVRKATDVVDAMRRIAASAVLFISRGDESGTHLKERELWKSAGVEPQGAWYVSAGQGMSAVLLMANERKAYTLTDRATYLTYKQRPNLEVLLQNQAPLFNPYCVIATNPARYPAARYLEAMRLIAWLTSPEGQQRIAGFRTEGQVLFHPTAVPVGGP